MMLTRQETATIVAALLFWELHGRPMDVRLPEPLGGEVPLTLTERGALIVRLTTEAMAHES